MELGQQKQQFSFAYIKAIASTAGFKMDYVSIDDDSIDVILSASGDDQDYGRAKVDIQVKCTESEHIVGGDIRYSLKLKNYEDLSVPRDELLVPRILVVVLVPKEVSQWLSQTGEELVMKKCAYWCSLEDFGETENIANVTVSLPLEQIFGTDSLCEIMRKIKSGQKL
jgi:hypothetical protein